jgi:hypothetical protein
MPTRGDLLTTSVDPGVAVVATTSTTHVFAIALAAPDATTSLVSAELNPDKAQALLKARQAAATTATEDQSTQPTVTRLIIAVLLVIGAITFLLLSFRSIVHSGVVSIGRNPRARLSVVYVTIGSMAMVIIIAGIVVLVALGVVVVPL